MVSINENIFITHIRICAYILLYTHSYYTLGKKQVRDAQNHQFEFNQINI